MTLPSSLFRTGVLGGMFALSVTGAFWVALSACESLSQVSPLPPNDASDLDAGQPPEESTSSSSSGAAGLDAGTSNAVRFRLSNQLQGPDAIDYCVKADYQGAVWENNLVSNNPQNPAKADGLFFGETSQSYVTLTAANAGSKFQVKIVPPGTDCADTAAQVYLTLAAPVTARQNTGVTIVAVGKLEKEDAGDANGKVTTMGDTLAPSPTSSLFRVFHGVPDIAAFDVVINGETVLTGVKYGTAFGFPYTSTTGYATINAGVPEGATLTLRSGTTVRSFSIPQRLRRGIASTVFVGGTKDKLTVTLCSDRTPDEGDLAKCQKLAAQE